MITNSDFDRIRLHSESIFACGTHSVHGSDHWQRVEDFGLELARETGADETVVRLFALLHDSCRLDDGKDLDHGPRAADSLASLAGTLFTINPNRLTLLEYAIRHHTDGQTSTDSIIGTCWDADRLDLGRVGMRPRARFMSTEVGRTRVRAMSEAEFRFYEELNDHLPLDRRKRSFVHQFSGRTAAAELIRALGVPLLEVELIFVNGRSVGEDYLVSDGDRVSVYPVFEAFDITPLVKLRSGPLRQIRFVVDADLRKLGELLQGQGFDTAIFGDSRESGAHTATHEGRIVLTRTASRLQEHDVTHGLLVRAGKPREQLDEVLHRLHLTGGGTDARGS